MPKTKPDTRAADLPNLNLPTKRVGLCDVPILQKPYTQILKAIENGTLDMSRWHGMPAVPLSEVDDVIPIIAEMFCGTTHCLAGWITHLCGLQGFELEGGEFNAGSVAIMILEASSPHEIPDFYGEACDAMEDIRRLAALEAQ